MAKNVKLSISSKLENVIVRMDNMNVSNKNALQHRLTYHWSHYMFSKEAQEIVIREYGEAALGLDDIGRVLFGDPKGKYPQYFFTKASTPRTNLLSISEYLVADPQMTMVCQITEKKKSRDNNYYMRLLDKEKSERKRQKLLEQIAKPTKVRFQSFHPKYFYEEVIKSKWSEQKPLGCYWEGLDTPLHSPVKMFFDVDMNFYEHSIYKEDIDLNALEIMNVYGHLPNDHEEALCDFVEFIKLANKFYFDKEVKNEHLYITCASSVRHSEKHGYYFKMSYHIIVNNGYYFSSLAEHKQFMKALFLKDTRLSQIKGGKVQKPATPKDWGDEMTVLHDKLFIETKGKANPIIDLSVYSKSRFFSIPLSYKLEYGKKTTHKPLGTWYSLLNNEWADFNNKLTFWHYCVRLYDDEHLHLLPYDNQRVTKYIAVTAVTNKKVNKKVTFDKDIMKAKKNLFADVTKNCPPALLVRLRQVVIDGDDGNTTNEQGDAMYPLHPDADETPITDNRGIRQEDGDGDFWEFDFRFDNPPQYKCAVCGYRHTDLNGFRIDIWENGQVKYWCKSENSQARSKYVVDLLNLLDPKDYSDESEFMKVVWALKGASNPDNEDMIENALIEWAIQDTDYNSQEHIDENRERFQKAKRGKFDAGVLTQAIMTNADLFSKLIPIQQAYNNERNQNINKPLTLQTRTEHSSLEWLIDAKVGGMSQYPVFPLEQNESEVWSITVKDGDDEKEVNKIFDTNSNTLMVQANMGVGKTQTLIDNLKAYIDKDASVSILVISYRVLLCNEYVKTFNDAGIPLKSYEELVENNKWDPDDWNCVVTCLDSVWKAFNGRDTYDGDLNSKERWHKQKDRVEAYDIVIVDELDSILSHFCSTTITDKGTLTNIQQATSFFLHNAHVVIAMDAFLKNSRCEEFLRMIRHNDVVTCIQNKWVRPTNKKMGAYVTFGNQEGNETKFIKDICDAVKKGKRVCIASMSAAFLNKHLTPILMTECQLQRTEFMFYTGDATATNRTLLIEHSKNILRHWGNPNYRVVGWSPTITAGVNYQVMFADRDNPTQVELKKVFDEMFLYCMLKEEHTCSVWDLLQMSGRVRQLRDTEVEQNAQAGDTKPFPTEPKDHNITALLCDGKPSSPHHWTMEKFKNKASAMDELSNRSKELEKFIGKFVPKQFWDTKFGDLDNVWWVLYLNNLIRQSDNALYWKKIFVDNFSHKMNVSIKWLRGGPYHQLLEKLKEHKLVAKDFEHLLSIENTHTITVRKAKPVKMFERATGKRGEITPLIYISEVLFSPH